MVVAASAVVSSMESFPNVTPSLLPMKFSGKSLTSLTASFSLELSELPLEDGIISEANSLSVQLLLLLQELIEFLPATAMAVQAAESERF